MDNLQDFNDLAAQLLALQQMLAQQQEQQELSRKMGSELKELVSLQEKEGKITLFDQLPSTDQQVPFLFQLTWQCDPSPTYHYLLDSLRNFLACFLPQYQTYHPSTPSHLPNEVLRIIHTYLLPPRNIVLQLLIKIPLGYPTEPPQILVQESNITQSFLLQKLLDSNNYYTTHLSDWEKSPKRMAQILLQLEKNLHKEKIEITCDVFYGANHSLKIPVSITINPFQCNHHDFLEKIERSVLRIKHLLFGYQRATRVSLTLIKGPIKGMNAENIDPNKSLFKNGYCKFQHHIECKATFI